MIDPFDISSNDADRVGEQSRIPPYEFNEFNGAPYRRRATLRYRLRSGKAFSMILLVDHFLYGLSYRRYFLCSITWVELTHSPLSL
jgi:hypothetical protein